MPKGTITLTFHCSKCGDSVIELPENYTNTSLATCGKCGVVLGPYGDIQFKVGMRDTPPLEAT